MSRYTDNVLAAARDRYENTNQPLRSIAAELLIGERNLQRLVTKYGWAKRSERVQGLPVAMQLLEQAKALAATADQPAHSRDSGVGWAKRSAPTKVPPQVDALPNDGCVGTAPSAAALQASADKSAPLPTLPAAPPAPSAVERIEALVLKEIEIEEAARAQLGGKPRMATASERSARTLATLTQTLHTLQRLRAGALPEHESLYDDDMPEDIDAFRLDLARRIAAFMESRLDDGDAGEDGDAAPLD